MDEAPKPASPTVSPDVDPLSGEEIDGRYKIQALIAEGASSRVYSARHLALDKLVALKILHLHQLDNPNNVARFHQEALALSRLDHPNILKILNSGVLKDKSPYLAMEYLEGKTLADFIREQGALDSQTAINIATQIASGIAAVHEKGILHRDLKPANIILCTDSNGSMLVKLIDFGLVRMQTSSQLTSTGIAVGSPAYMSPEQCQNKELSTASDIYSLGCILYEMLCGSRNCLYLS